MMMKLVLLTFVFFVISAKKQIAKRQQTQRILHNSDASPKKSKCYSKRADVYGWCAKKVGGWRIWKMLFPTEYDGEGEGMCAGSPSETRGWGVNKTGDPTKGGIDKLLRGWSYPSTHNAFCLVELLIFPFFLKLVLGWVEQLHSCRIPFLIHSLSWRASLYARLISFPNRVNY